MNVVMQSCTRMCPSPCTIICVYVHAANEPSGHCQMYALPLTGHHYSARLISILYIDLCTLSYSEIRTPPYCSSLLSQWCPYYRGFTIQDSLLWSQWCPYYRGFTVQDSLLWSQWCPYYRGVTVLLTILWMYFVCVCVCRTLHPTHVHAPLACLSTFLTCEVCMGSVQLLRGLCLNFVSRCLECVYDSC